MAEPVRCAATAVTSFEATGERYLHGYSLATLDSSHESEES
jgi:hypothetical protein